jgi:hypothetical protein
MSNNTFNYVVANILIVSLMFSTGCAGLFSGTKSSGRYIYNYTLTEPVANDQLLFKDEYVTIQFKFDESAIKFQLQNISDAPMSVVWENVAIVLNNRVFPVKNTATLYQTNLDHPSSVIIPSLGYIRDLVIPSEFIGVEKNAWVEKDLFPTDDQGSPARKKLITKYVGSQIKLLLPIKIGEVVQDYSFTFKVKGISPLPENRVPAVKERPTPPQVVTSAGSTNTLMPVLIAGGILVVAIYALSKEKASPINF